jgi:type I restriction enzyme S subunit
VRKKTILDFRPVSFSIPHGWILSSFDEVIDIVKGKKPIDLGEKSESRLFAYINIESFEKQIYHQYTSAINCPVCKNKDILIVWDGARCGLIGRGVSGSIGSTLAKINNYGLHSSYLYYFLQTKYGLINKNPRGIGIPHVDPEVFWTINIPIPPLPEQQRIVTKIEELFTQLDAGVASLKKVQAQLKRYRQAVLKAAFEGRLTHKWREEHKGEIEPASELLKKISNAAKKKTTRKYDIQNPIDFNDWPSLPKEWTLTQVQDVGDVQLGRQRAPVHHNGINMRPYLRVANVFENFIDISDVKTMNFSPEEYEIYHLEYGDILLNEGQSKELVGRPAMFRNEIPEVCFQNTLVRFRAYEGLIPEYALQLFISYLHNGQFIKIARQSTNIAHLGAERFAKTPFPLPPLLEQKEILLELDRQFSLITKMNDDVITSLRQAETLRQSILKQAFEGRLVPQDPNDEPASVLLEGLKAEKARHAAGTKKGKTLQPKSPKRKVRNVN